MADYHPLIARAVHGLDKSTGETRRALYERARTALVNQLRSVEPPLDEADITRERLALEDAIRKVEAEAIRRMVAEPAETAAPAKSAPEQGLRDFHETAAHAAGLGHAAAAANRAAHMVYAAVPDDHAADVIDAKPPGAPYFEPPAEHRASAEPIAPARPAEPLPPPRPPREEGDIYARPPRAYGRIIKYLVLLLVLVGVAGAAYWQRQPIMQMVANYRSASPAPTQQPAQTLAPAVKPKIADRIGPGNNASAPATAPAAAVAQKVVLYDEDPNNPQGKRTVGSALWRTETVSPGPGLAPELAIRADVEIPERHIRMTWSLRRNTDKALPASHTIEIMFTLPPDFPEGGIANVPGVLMKQDEQARGVPLAGLAVKVTNGYFLIGLSAVDVDVQRNLQLLKDEDWFDIPIVYTNGKRAILALEKGTPGARAFEEAFRAWGE